LVLRRRNRCRMVTLHHDRRGPRLTLQPWVAEGAPMH
jgi:hypothetical protein